MGFKQSHQIVQADNLIVVDNSVIMRWIFNDGFKADQEYARKVLLQIQTSKMVLLVPSLWVNEASFVVAAYVKRNEIEQDEALSSFERLFSLSQIITTKETPKQLLKFSIEFGISSYDASYALLARQFNCPLAALNKKLRKAVKNSNGKLFE